LSIWLTRKYHFFNLWFFSGEKSLHKAHSPAPKFNSPPIMHHVQNECARKGVGATLAAKQEAFLFNDSTSNKYFSLHQRPHLEITNRTLTQPIPVSLAPIIGLRLGELVGFEHPYVLFEPVFPTAPLQFFYLGHHLIQDILIVDDV
jgi:hypothetical protein